MRYFFHIRDHGEVIEDDTGLDLPDDAAAQHEAAAAARSFQREAKLTGESVDHQAIEVTNEDGKVLFTILLEDHRMPPSNGHGAD